MSGMPIDLTKIRIRPRGALKYRQLEDELSAAIESGQLAPGEELPNDAEIRSTLGLSDGTVRKAMDGLRRRGLIERRSGATTRVRERQPVRRVTTTRYARWLELLMSGEAPESSAFTEDYGVPWGRYRLDSTFTVDTASAGEAHRLDLPAGSQVLRRVFVKYDADGRPRQWQESVMPLDIVEGTAVADPDNQPWVGGTEGELFHLGYAVERVEEDFRARPVRDEEIRVLELDEDETVWDAVRTTYAEGRPVDTSLVVMSASVNVLHFETDLRPLLEPMSPELRAELARRRKR